MYHCPSCKQESFSLVHKWRSTLAYAECSNCQRPCCVPDSTGNAIWAIAVILLVLVAIGTSYAQSILVGIAGIGLVVTVYVLLWHRTSLIPVSPERAAMERRVSWAAAAALALLSIFK